MSTVIVGAGIVGVSTAYYLSLHQTPADGPIHLVETTDRLFASASGFAGGFLARDWHAPAVAELAALSFDQHRALAAQHDGRTHWSYAASTALSFGLADEPGTPPRPRRRGEDWLRQGTSRSTAAPAAPVQATPENGAQPAWLRRAPGDTLEILADDESTAQVDPLRLCEFLLDQARARGVHLHQPARVVAIGTDAHNTLASVTLETGSVAAGSVDTPTTTILPCTKLVVAAGAWTPQVFDTLFPGQPLLPIHNYAGHSLVVRQPATATSKTDTGRCHALFAAGGPLTYCPEMFSRVDGTLYMAGLNSSTEPLPRLATESLPVAAKLDDLMASCRRVLGLDQTPSAALDLDVVRAGHCHRPATPWGLPLVLRMPDALLHGADGTPLCTNEGAAGGVFVAAGHGPWGISLAPGTGMVLAELLQGRPLSADLSGLGLRENPRL